MLLKIVASFIRILATYLLGSSVAIILIICLILTLVGTYLTVLNMGENRDEEYAMSEVLKNGSIYNMESRSGFGNNSLNSLRGLDSSLLNHTLALSDHKEHLATSVKRSDFTDIARIILSNSNTFINTSNAKVTSSYIGYMYGGYHYLNYTMPIETYKSILPTRPNLDKLRSSGSIDTGGYKVGVKYDSKETIFMDCSGLVAWLYGTLFVAIDGDNPDIDTLANWFYMSSSSSDYANVYKCNKVAFNQLKPGDILVRSGHVGIVISETEYIHASIEYIGIVAGKLTDGNFANSQGFITRKNARAYRPKIKFADD